MICGCIEGPRVKPMFTMQNQSKKSSTDEEGLNTCRRGQNGYSSISSE
jgi:hypothetical protein